MPAPIEVSRDSAVDSFQPLPRFIPLAARLAAATPAQRGAVVLTAIASGETIDLPGADLRGVNLRPGRATRGEGPARPTVVPQPVVLDGANLAGATLSGACLAGARLRRANLDGALLVGADLRGADLTGASLRGANLSGALLRRADLSWADLRGASLLTADLSQTTATGADWRETLLQSAVLSRAGLRDADFRWSRLDGANLAGAELDGACFEGAVLALANLTGARLSAATDFSFAFLHHARLDRACLTRAHLGSGIGEDYTDLSLACDTYRQLARHFTALGHPADARWAHRQACQVATATHRPDCAARYHAAHKQAGVARPLFLADHGLLWLVGHLADLVTGYGTSARRIVATLAAAWLLFTLVFSQAGAVIHLGGEPIGWRQILGYSAAALTPIDAYPLVATSELARVASAAEGIIGMALLGALGYVVVSRTRAA
jgi:uncharacterized protein YjbI with pentapeptide repeats